MRPEVSHKDRNEALQRGSGSQDHGGENAREQGAIGVNMLRSGEDGREKTREFGGHSKFGCGAGKIHSWRQEQRGHFRMGAGSMEPLKRLRNAVLEPHFHEAWGS